jgi:hypothetical protein
MSTTYFDIRKALDTQLDAMSGVPPLAGWGFKYTPTKDTLFIRKELFSITTTKHGLGPTGYDGNAGIYALNIFGPMSESTGDINPMVMADKVADQFKINTRLVFNSTEVIINNLDLKPGRNNGDGWYQIPIDIFWTSTTTPRA